MFKVTWIVLGKIKTITHPDYFVAWDVYAALNNNGECARIWDKDGNLIR